MSVQYLSDEKGQVTAVQLPIKEWEMIKSQYPDIEHLDSKLLKWQKEIIDSRLLALENNPERIRLISELLDELDK